MPKFWPILVFTFLNSLGTGVVSNGIFFVAKHGFGFSVTRLFVLGILLGVTYVAAAWTAGPLLRRAMAKYPAVSERSVLGWLMVAMASLCALPIIAMQFGPEGGLPPAWTIWAMVALYSPLSGVLWPIVEAYVASGREGASLRSAMGTWNVVWSAATFAVYVFMGPLIEHHAPLMLALLGGVHLLSAGALARFDRRPAPHGPGGADPEDHADADRYARLLRVFRTLLPASYLVSSALGAYLPTIMDRLPLETSWHTPIAGAWLLARVFTFWTLQHWHGWHGRWGAPVAGIGLLVVGFAACICSTLLPGGELGVALVVAGLLCFGAGMATIYVGALYYALASSDERVDSGGTHEALIGLGYTGGPACGLGVALAVDAGALEPERLGPVMMVPVVLIALGAGAWAARSATRSAREP